MFKFRLQRVLDLRARTEEDAAIRLAAAREAAEQARAAYERLEATRRASRAQAQPAAGTAASVGELQYQQFVVERLDEHLAEAHRTAEAAEGEARQRLEQLTAAMQDRRVLDKLRERHLEAWRSAETQAERVSMDAVALARFALAPKAAQ